MSTSCGARSPSNLMDQGENICGKHVLNDHLNKWKVTGQCREKHEKLAWGHMYILAKSIMFMFVFGSLHDDEFFN